MRESFAVLELLYLDNHVSNSHLSPWGASRMAIQGKEKQGLVLIQQNVSTPNKRLIPVREISGFANIGPLSARVSMDFSNPEIVR